MLALMCRLQNQWCWLQVAFPKVHFFEGPLFRRFIAPKVHCSEKKVHCSEGSLFRKKRFIVPKVYRSEGSFSRNRGSLLRRFFVTNVHCSEIEVHIVPKGHSSGIGFHCSESLLFRRFSVPKFDIFSQTGKC